MYDISVPIMTFCTAFDDCLEFSEMASCIFWTFSVYKGV